MCNYLSNFTDLIDLIVVDKNRWIKTCPFSNLVIGDLLDESYVTFKPRFNKSVKFVVNELKFIDADKKEILFVDELSLDYDFLIMAPGMDIKESKFRVIQLTIMKIYLIAGMVKIKYLTLKD